LLSNCSVFCYHVESLLLSIPPADDSQVDTTTAGIEDELFDIPPEEPLPEKEENCPICLDSFPLSMLRSATHCGHHYCIADLAEVVKLAIDARRLDDDGIKCPVPECIEHYNPQTIQDCLEIQGMPELFALYLERMSERKFPKCPYCRAFFDNSELGEQAVVRCPHPSCSQSFCIRGCDRAHRGMSCEDYQSRKERSLEEEESLRVLNEELEKGDLVQ